MDISHGLIFAACGLLAGLLSGVLGIGGGIILVPMIKSLGYSPVEAVATSSMAIVMTSLSGSFQNYRMGKLDFKKVILLGLPSFLTARIGVWLTSLFPGYLLLVAFSIFLIFNIFLASFRRTLAKQKEIKSKLSVNPIIVYLFTGGLTGILAGLFGIGGGLILVPLQMLLLGTNIKSAIQTSLGVIVITSISATGGHATQGNVLFIEGILLGSFGLIGAQVSTRFLPRLPEKIVSLLFTTLLVIICLYMLYQAYGLYQM